MLFLATSTELLIHPLDNFSSLFFCNVALAATFHFVILRFVISVQEQIRTNMPPTLTRPHLPFDLILRQKPHFLPLFLSLPRDFLVFISISHILR